MTEGLPSRGFLYGDEMRKFCLLHPTKTAGVSIYVALKPYLYDYWFDKTKDKKEKIKASDPRSIFFGHVPAWKMIDEGKIEADYFNDVFIFACKRNAWKRTVSSYFYRNCIKRGITLTQALLRRPVPGTGWYPDVEDIQACMETSNVLASWA